MACGERQFPVFVVRHISVSKQGIYVPRLTLNPFTLAAQP